MRTRPRDRAHRVGLLAGTVEPAPAAAQVAPFARSSPTQAPSTASSSMPRPRPNRRARCVGRRPAYGHCRSRQGNVVGASVGARVHARAVRDGHHAVEQRLSEGLEAAPFRAFGGRLPLVGTDLLDMLAGLGAARCRPGLRARRARTGIATLGGVIRVTSTTNGERQEDENDKASSSTRSVRHHGRRCIQPSCRRREAAISDAIARAPIRCRPHFTWADHPSGHGRMSMSTRATADHVPPCSRVRRRQSGESRGAVRRTASNGIAGTTVASAGACSVISYRDQRYGTSFVAPGVSSLPKSHETKLHASSDDVPTPIGVP